MPGDLSEHPLRDQGHRPGRPPLAELLVPIALAVVGGVLLFAGYWGASDSTDPGEQIPHLASGTIPGAVLVIAAALLLHRLESRRAREEAAGVAARLDALVDWLSDDGAGAAEDSTGDGTAATTGTSLRQ